MKIIAFKNEEEYYHVVRKIKKMKRFLTELCNVIEESHEDEDEDEGSETIVYKGGKAYHMPDDEDSEMYYKKGMKKSGRFSY